MLELYKACAKLQHTSDIQIRTVSGRGPENRTELHNDPIHDCHESIASRIKQAMKTD